MLLPFLGANPNFHRPRALPWAGCLLAFQAVTSRKVYRTPITYNIKAEQAHVGVPAPLLYLRYVLLTLQPPPEGWGRCCFPLPAGDGAYGCYRVGVSCAPLVVRWAQG